MVPGGTVEFDDLDVVMYSLDHALVSIRTLDQLFERGDKAAYQEHRTTDGKVINGLVAPRDSAVHGSELIEPDLARAVQYGDYFIVFPRWKPRMAIPPDVFARKRPEALAGYDDAVAGRAVHDTLFDAFKFFADCNTSIVPWGDGGQIKGFPLAPLPIGGTYFRLHPDWPSHEVAGKQLRARVQEVQPAGRGRRIDGTVVGPDGVLYLCGYTEVLEGHWSIFTEPMAQVLLDVLSSYPYQIMIDGKPHAVEGGSGTLAVEGRLLEEIGLPDLTSDERWAGFVELSLADDYYAVQRRSR